MINTEVNKKNLNGCLKYLNVQENKVAQLLYGLRSYGVTLTAEYLLFYKCHLLSERCAFSISLIDFVKNHIPSWVGTYFIIISQTFWHWWSCLTAVSSAVKVCFLGIVQYTQHLFHNLSYTHRKNTEVRTLVVGMALASVTFINLLQTKFQTKTNCALFDLNALHVY